MPNDDPVLYRHVGCPYCERVVRLLERYDVPFRSRFVVPTHSKRDHVKRISGTRSVPLLVDEAADITMAESDNIVEYVERKEGDGTVDDVLRIDLSTTESPVEGDSAPTFTRPLVGADYWEDVPLSSVVADEPTLLVFYPMDGTGAASYNWIEIRDRGWEPSRVVGVSISTPYEHRRFIDRHELPYRLYSDPGNGVAEAFDVVHDQGGMAGLRGARPAAFLLDPDLTVRYSWVTDEWPASPPYDEFEAALAQSSS